jgi:hypothetical protein
MPKYTVEEVLEIISGLGPEEKNILKTRLRDVLASSAVPHAAQQTRSMTVGGNFQVGGSGVTVDMSQQQAIGNTTVGPTQGNADAIQALLQALESLQQQILSSTDLNLVEKATAKVPLATATAELQKDKPNKDLIDQSVEALRKGLAGAEALAEPVMRVAALLAKAWVVL